MTIPPLVIGCGILVLTGRALILGAASASGDGITRKDEPIFYWGSIVAAFIAVAFLFSIGLRR